MRFSYFENNLPGNETLAAYEGVFHPCIVIWLKCVFSKNVSKIKHGKTLFLNLMK